jgi:hypothetical protein
MLSDRRAENLDVARPGFLNQEPTEALAGRLE